MSGKSAHRTELARLLGKHYGTSAAGDDYLWAMADIVLELLHPVVTTAEELDALPYGAVVLDKHGKAWMWVEDEDTSHWAAHDDFLYKAESLLSFYGPVTVLHVGGAE